MHGCRFRLFFCFRSRWCVIWQAVPQLNCNKNITHIYYLLYIYIRFGCSVGRRLDSGTPWEVLWTAQVKKTNEPILFFVLITSSFANLRMLLISKWKKKKKTNKMVEPTRSACFNPFFVLKSLIWKKIKSRNWIPTL